MQPQQRDAKELNPKIPSHVGLSWGQICGRGATTRRIGCSRRAAERPTCHLICQPLNRSSNSPSHPLKLSLGRDRRRSGRATPSRSPAELEGHALHQQLLRHAALAGERCHQRHEARRQRGRFPRQAARVHLHRVHYVWRVVAVLVFAYRSDVVADLLGVRVLVGAAAQHCNGSPAHFVAAGRGR